MNTLTDEERNALRDSVHRLLAEKSTEAAVRATMETTSGFDAELWKNLAEMGIAGLLIDEKFGGSGAGPLELEAVMEEAGAALLCSPLLASSVLAAQLLRALDDRKINERLLPQMATGAIITSAVLTGDAGSWLESDITIKAVNVSGQWQLSGRGSYVLHGINADVLLVVAKTDEGLMAFEVPAGTEGVKIAGLATLDHTQRLAAVDFNNAQGQAVNTTVPVWQAVQQAIDLTLVGLAGEQAGGAKKVLEFTVDYAKTRIQFGRAIGSFQAIKHMASDLLLETESAISAARYAASSLANSSEKTNEAISLAAFACADVYVKTAKDSVQMHGGIAFTWEHPAHLYLKRARADAYLFGSPSHFRERYLQAITDRTDTNEIAQGAGA